MVGIAHTALCCAGASVLMLLASAPVLAQDTASAPSYPQAQARAAHKAAHVRRAAPRKTVRVPLPPRRPEQKPASRDVPDKQAALPLPPERPAQTRTEQKSEPATVPIPPAAPKIATAPVQEPKRKEEAAPPPAPLKEGGTNDWRLVTDPATGIVIGIPRRLLTEMRDAPHGTRWSAPHGEIQLETFRVTEPGLTLAALFERMKREPANRKVEFNANKDDSFVLGGTQGLRDFYIRAASKGAEIRGFTLLYDVAMETIMEPLRPTISNAFSPFPEKPAAFALPPKAVEYGSGVVVSRDGHILTSARLVESCATVKVADHGPAERVTANDGMALLRVYGARKLAAAGVANSRPAGPLSLVGVPDPQEQQGGSATRELSAKLTGEAIDLAKPGPVAGFSGAAAFDREGRLAGLVDLSGVALASTGAPPLRMIGAGAIRAFLAREGVQVSEAGSGEARAAVVRVICVRK